MRIIDKDRMVTALVGATRKMETQNAFLAGVATINFVQDFPEVTGTIVNWIPVAERLPEKTTDHMLVYCSERKYIGIVTYSAKHQAFNASDYMDTAPNAFKDVLYWAEPILPPEGV